MYDMFIRLSLKGKNKKKNLSLSPMVWNHTIPYLLQSVTITACAIAAAAAAVAILIKRVIVKTLIIRFLQQCDD